MKHFDITVQKMVMTALLSVTIIDLIKGLSKDLLAPIFDMVIPGDINKPVNIFGLRLHLTRLIMRIINFAIALTGAYYLNIKMNK